MSNYFAVAVRVYNTRMFLAWFSDDVDGFVCGTNGRPLAFRRIKDLSEAASAIGVEVPEVVTACMNFDRIERDIRRRRVVARHTLDAWNLLSDFIATTGKTTEALEGIDRREAKRVYNKLFFACNLHAMTPDGRRFRAMWTDDDITFLRKMMRRGRAIVRASLRIQARCQMYEAVT